MSVTIPFEAALPASSGPRRGRVNGTNGSNGVVYGTNGSAAYSAAAYERDQAQLAEVAPSASLATLGLTAVP